MPRNRCADARAKGRRMVTFEISPEFDALIDRVAAKLAREQGTCTRVQAVERMGREGAKTLLKK